MTHHIPEKIKAYNAARNPNYLKLKFKEMRSDKYRFYRAITDIFYEDMSKHQFLYKAPHAWLCGDLHLENLGSYKGDNNLAYFGVNDFDECILGPCTLDLIRMLCCIYIASENWKITRQDTLGLCRLFLDTYFKNLRQGYIKEIERETAQGVMKDFLNQVSERSRAAFISAIIKTKKGKIKLRPNNVHIIELPKKEKQAVISAVHLWAKHMPNPDFYTVKDVAHRIAGCSSLGLKRYVALVEGNGNENYLIDIKETNPSCLAKIIKTKQPKWQSEAQRLIEVQRRILSSPPALLASIDIGKSNYVLKELQPLADRIDYNLFKGKLKKLKTIVHNIASIYAWGNLRSSGRQGSAIADELIDFASDPNKLKKQLISLASSYTKNMSSYYSAYCKAYDKGYFEDKMKK